MIDRLEELLEQVEEQEIERKSALTGQLGPVSYPAGDARPKAEETALVEEELSALMQQEENSSKAPNRNRGLEQLVLGQVPHIGQTSALQALYRQLARETAGVSVEKSGSVAVVRETVPGPAVGLTAGQLDLAMRRDSRRYDGGMTIY